MLLSLLERSLQIGTDLVFIKYFLYLVRYRDILIGLKFCSACSVVDSIQNGVNCIRKVVMMEVPFKHAQM